MEVGLVQPIESKGSIKFLTDPDGFVHAFCIQYFVKEDR